MDWAQMAAELLHNVARCLPAPRGYRAFPLVCRRWAEAYDYGGFRTRAASRAIVVHDVVWALLRSSEFAPWVCTDPETVKRIIVVEIAPAAEAVYEYPDDGRGRACTYRRLAEIERHLLERHRCRADLARDTRPKLRLSCRRWGPGLSRLVPAARAPRPPIVFQFTDSEDEASGPSAATPAGDTKSAPSPKRDHDEDSADNEPDPKRPRTDSPTPDPCA